jgi:hypothetical protein
MRLLMSVMGVMGRSDPFRLISRAMGGIELER